MTKINKEKLLADLLDVAIQEIPVCDIKTDAGVITALSCQDFAQKLILKIMRGNYDIDIKSEDVKE
jgi:hypothetical protein